MRVKVAVVVAALAALGGTGLMVAAAASSSTSRSRLHLGCPPSDRHSLASSPSGADAQLVPPGATTLLLCRYSPFGGPQPPVFPPQSLLEQRLITDASEVSRLASGLDALAPQTGTYSCPADDVENVLAVFRYPSGPADPVTIDLTGCEPITNGHVNRLGLDAPVVGQIASLLPAAHSARLRVHLRLCGGPAPGGCWIESFTSCDPRGCARLDQVTLTAADGVSWELRLHRGRGAIRVPAGRYTVQLIGEGRRVPSKVVQTRRTVLRPDRTRTLTFGIDVP